jgi:Uri superfamily endonuclease
VNDNQSESGTYALVLYSESDTVIQAGRRHRMNVEPGYYIYTGSAFGPGGVRARVTRHCRGGTSRHWHIDYLREAVTPLYAWYSLEPVNLEHDRARALSEMAVVSPVKGFGCTDCRCFSHLFHMAKKPGLSWFTGISGCPVESWRCQ